MSCYCRSHEQSGKKPTCPASLTLQLQRHAIHQTQPQNVPASVHDVLRSSGRPLDAATRSFFEPRFGQDFGAVRMHTDAKAAEPAQQVAGSYGNVLQRQSADEDDGASAPAGPGTVLAPGSEHEFTAEGVKVVIFRRCGTDEFGFDKIEAATRAALDKVFHSECISADRRARMQKNLVQFGGLNIFCKQPGEMHLGPTKCAESTGGTGQIRLSSLLFSQDRPAVCNNLGAVMLHEIVHVSLFAQLEQLPRSCEMSCFNHDHGEGPEQCQNLRDPNMVE